MRPMMGFAEQSNLASSSCNAGLHCRKYSSQMTDRGAADREIHPALGVRSMQHCYSHCHLAANLSRLRFFCGIFSAFAWQPPVPRQGLRHAMAAEKPGSVSCHSSLRQRCRGFAACRPQAGKIPRIEVKCLYAGPD
jgi:hypothetical protein